MLNVNFVKKSAKGVHYQIVYQTEEKCRPTTPSNVIVDLRVLINDYTTVMGYVCIHSRQDTKVPRV